MILAMLCALVGFVIGVTLDGWWYVVALAVASLAFWLLTSPAPSPHPTDRRQQP